MSWRLLHLLNKLLSENHISSEACFFCRLWHVLSEQEAGHADQGQS